MGISWLFTDILNMRAADLSSEGGHHLAEKAKLTYHRDGKIFRSGQIKNLTEGRTKEGTSLIVSDN